MADRTRGYEHRFAAQLENALYLLDMGTHIEEVARRLGLSVEGVTKMLERHPRRSP